MNTRWRNIGVCTLLALLLVTTGCTQYFESRFVPVQAGAVFSPVPAAQVVDLGNLDLNATLQTNYPAAQLVGRSDFNDTNLDTYQLQEFAKAKGADVVLWRKTFISNQVRTGYHEVPRRETTTVIRTDSEGHQVVTEVYQDKTDLVPYQDTYPYYRHELIYLRCGP